MNLKKLILIFFAWQLFIVFVTWISPAFLTLRTTYLGGATQAYASSPILYSRANFDGNHYLHIARWGYGYSQQAFFPFYPFLIKLFTQMFNSDIASGLFISITSFFIALVFLHKLLILDYSKQISDWTIFILLLFPVSFFFSFVYTEGVFFLLAISAFYAARTRHWLLAGLLGGIAAYTRLIGMALFPAFVLEFLLQKSINKRQMYLLLLIPCGLGLYMFSLWQTTGDPLGFIHVQALFGQGRSDHLILIYQVYWRYIKMIFTVNRADPLFLTILLEFGSAIIFTLTSICSLFRQRASYAIYNLICIFLPPLTGSFTSLSRYALVAFPSFIILAQLISPLSTKYKYIISFILCLVSSLFLMMFARGFWVA